MDNWTDTSWHSKLIRKGASKGSHPCSEAYHVVFQLTIKFTTGCNSKVHHEHKSVSWKYTMCTMGHFVCFPNLCHSVFYKTHHGVIWKYPMCTMVHLVCFPHLYHSVFYKTHHGTDWDKHTKYTIVLMVYSQISPCCKGAMGYLLYTMVCFGAGMTSL